MESYLHTKSFSWIGNSCSMDVKAVKWGEGDEGVPGTGSKRSRKIEKDVEPNRSYQNGAVI